MSYTTLYKIDPDGDVLPYARFRNSHRSAMTVWIEMAVRYEILPAGEEFRLLLDPEMVRRVWDLGLPGGAPTVPEHDRIVMLSTFDSALCRACDFPRLIAAFGRFGREHAPGSSLVEQAEAIERLAREHPEVLGCGWRQTSVSEDPWVVATGEDEGETRPYNIHRDAGHFWIFDEIDPEPAP